MYFKTCLPVKVLDISFLSECINFELQVENKLCNFLIIYRSPSRSSDEFQEFMKNFELNLESVASKNPFMVSILGDLNAKSSNWYRGDISNLEGNEIDYLSCQFGLKQIINEPTHILENSATCIDLIFTSQPNLVIESGTFSSLHPNCHHQITYAKFNLKIFYPPPYEREFWHYNQANADLINHSISNFNWDYVLASDDVDMQVSTFNKVFLNVMSNFVPHEIIVCDDKDPPWFNKHIKNLILHTESVSRNILHSRNNQFLQRRLVRAKELIQTEINLSKQKYFERISKKLCNSNPSSKCYWSLLKSFLIDKKIPLIPPLYHGTRFITDFNEKCNLFNSFFAKQCSIIDTDSTIPANLTKLTDKYLIDLDINIEDILKIVQKLDINKAHGHDMISIRMLKICQQSICKPLLIIFKNCVRTGKFPTTWKKANVVPIHKKGDKQTLKNYRPISLLPICGKIFERLLYNRLYSFLDSNSLLSSKQSGFRPGDSCINQLLSITHGIYQSYDDGLETRGVFLDISKAFDRVWHEGLIYKLKRNGIDSNFLNILVSFLSFRKQRVVLNGSFSSWSEINAGVPQGSILGPLLFLIYINDLPEGLISNAKLFADDTCIFSKVYDPVTSARVLNDDLEKISEWAYQWKMSFNPDPNKPAQEVIFSHKISQINHPILTLNDSQVEKTSCQKHLGMLLDSKLNFYEHVQNILTKVNRSIGMIRKLNSFLPRSSLLTIYKSFVRPQIDYGDVIYDQAFNLSFQKKIESIQYNASLAILGAIRGSSMEKVYQELGLESLQSRRWMRKLCLFYKIYREKSPNYLFETIPSNNRFYALRNPENVPMLRTNHNFFKNSFFPSVIIEWNKLDLEIRNSESLLTFKNKILSFIRPSSNSIYGINNALGVKYLSRLRLGLSHLREHKSKHGFLDTVDPYCNCGQDVESIIHFFLHCPIFDNIRATFFRNIRGIDNDILNQDEFTTTQILLFGHRNYSNHTNTEILETTIEYILESDRFSGPLF